MRLQLQEVAGVEVVAEKTKVQAVVEDQEEVVHGEMTHQV